QQQFRVAVETNYRAAQRPRFTERVERGEAEVRQFTELERSVVKELKEGFEDLEKDAADRRMPDRVVNQDTIQQERDFLDRINRTILKQTAELGAPERVKVYQPAEVPTKSDMKKQLAATGFGGIFGLGLV